MLNWQAMESLVTERLLLRRWRESDRQPFFALNADPCVMEYMPAVLRPEQSDQVMERIHQHFQKHGFGLFAVELCQRPAFIGYIRTIHPQLRGSLPACCGDWLALSCRILGAGTCDRGRTRSASLWFRGSW